MVVALIGFESLSVHPSCLLVFSLGEERVSEDTLCVCGVDVISLMSLLRRVNRSNRVIKSSRG